MQKCRNAETCQQSLGHRTADSQRSVAKRLGYTSSLYATWLLASRLHQLVSLPQVPAVTWLRSARSLVRHVPILLQASLDGPRIMATQGPS